MKRILMICLLALGIACTESIVEPEVESQITRISGEMWADREYRDGYDRVIFEWLQMHNDGTVWLHWIEPPGPWIKIELEKIGNYRWLRFAEAEQSRQATEEEIKSNP